MRNNTFIIRELDKNSSIFHAIQNQHLNYESKVLDQEIVESNYYISKKLDIPLATKLFYLKKARIIEGEIRAVEKMWIKLDEVKGIENLDYNNASLLSVLKKKKGIDLLKTSEELLIVACNKEESEILNINEGEEILLTKGVCYKKDDTSIEYFEISSDTEFFRFRSISKYE